MTRGRPLAGVAAVLLVTSACTASGADAGRIRAISIPRTAIVGAPWQAVLAVRGGAKPKVVATGPARLIARVARTAGGRFRASVTFPRPGRWTVSAYSGRSSARLGAVVVDIRPTPLLADLFALAAEPSGTLLVGQVHGGGIVRATVAGRTEGVVPDVSVFHLSTGGSGAAYVTLHDSGGVFRLEPDGRLTPLGLPASAGVAVEGADGVYVLDGDRLLRRDREGSVSTVAEGFSKPLGLATGPDGDIYVGDTGNGVVRRIDRGTQMVTTVARDLGYIVSVAVAVDGTIWSSSAEEGGHPGVWRTTPSGDSTRVLPTEVSAVALGADGSVYACAFRERRILRIDPHTGGAETILRGRS
jgi:hypothetical protein